jgi:hypothetical protein
MAATCEECIIINPKHPRGESYCSHWDVVIQNPKERILSCDYPLKPTIIKKEAIIKSDGELQ